MSAPSDKPLVAPRAADQTVRAALRETLRGARPLTALELSSLIGIASKQVGDHLEHLRKSLAGSDEQLVVAPARCNGCDYVFEQRDRMSRPSRCPRCKSERIEPPRFRIETR
ncbi:MAG: transcriptional regulator [Deltaproteobacteria bacterium]|jgi:predicted Zn-ribbon and HTH transcriptional regulator|nr:transcriptional regulator [Deltaproteobacteria bacterium]MBK8234566.1 transcriptional regulator [Deltaproteobacteria bacterium]MBK8715308.1 transcriptional regulator [Deltaproteobacteria bacterium]MBP7284989.1 transcriptional regulator [Nannocystaceae bacterium]